MQDLRDKIIRDRYDRDRDRDRPPREGERRHYDRTSDKRKDKSSDFEERKNSILMADKMLEEKKHVLSYDDLKPGGILEKYVNDFREDRE